MNPQCATVYHMALNSEMKFRCETDLVARFERIASLERRKVSDLARLVFEDYIKAQEHAMNLVLHDKPAAGLPARSTEDIKSTLAGYKPTPKRRKSGSK